MRLLEIMVIATKIYKNANLFSNSAVYGKNLLLWDVFVGQAVKSVCLLLKDRIFALEYICIYFKDKAKIELNV